MLKPILSGVFTTLLVSQFALACPRPDSVNGCETPDQKVGLSIVQSLREMGTAQFWTASVDQLNRQYGNPENLKKMGVGMMGIFGLTTTSFGAISEIEMRVYGVRDPLQAGAMAWADFGAMSPRLELKFVKPGSKRYQRLQEKLKFFEDMKSKSAAGGLAESEARLARRYSRGALVVGAGFLLGAYLLHEEKEGGNSETSDIYDRPATMAEVLASDMTDQEIVDLARQHEGLKINLMTTAEFFKELAKWDQIYAE